MIVVDWLPEVARPIGVLRHVGLLAVDGGAGGVVGHYPRRDMGQPDDRGVEGADDLGPRAVLGGPDDGLGRYLRFVHGGDRHGLLVHLRLAPRELRRVHRR